MMLSALVVLVAIAMLLGGCVLVFFGVKAVLKK